MDERNAFRSSWTRNRCFRLVSALLLFAVHCANVPAFPAQPYLPADDGSITRTYQDGSSTYTVRITAVNVWDQVEEIYFLNRSLPSGFNMFSDSPNGISFIAQPAANLALAPGTLYWWPPFKIANAHITLGETVASKGEVTMRTQDNLLIVSGVYSGSSRPVGFETVTTPLGTFHALRFDYTLTISLTISNHVVTANSTSTSWLVSGIGMVKDQTSVNGGPPKITHLIGTNIAGASRPGVFVLPILMTLLE